MRAVDDPYVGIRLATPLVRPYWRMRFHTFGQGAVVHKPYWLHGARQMAIGDEAFILRAWLTVDKSAWGQPDPALRIGDRTTVFPGTMVGAKESLVIEEDVSIGAYCLIVDYEHRVDGPHDSLARNPLEASPVRIGRGSSIAQRTAVLRGSTIGRYCFIGTNSVVHGDIPDYAIAAGAPARIIGWTRGHVPTGDPEGEEQ
jgi:serine acetyltransferase